MAVASGMVNDDAKVYHYHFLNNCSGAIDVQFKGYIQYLLINSGGGFTMSFPGFLPQGSTLNIKLDKPHDTGNRNPPPEDIDLTTYQVKQGEHTSLCIAICNDHDIPDYCLENSSKRIDLSELFDIHIAHDQLPERKVQTP